VPPKARAKLNPVIFAFGCALAATRIADAAAAPVNPGDDFDAYANAAWLAATQIPEGSPRWNARDEINELTRRQ
jgi:predicted metalloendopeptidase